jgi:hypothetical protein
LTAAGAAVHADDDRRDALAHRGERGAILKEAAIVMAVRVDESGRQCQSAGVDNGLAIRQFERADCNDALAHDAHRAAARGCPGAIDD